MYPTHIKEFINLRYIFLYSASTEKKKIYIYISWIMNKRTFYHYSQKLDISVNSFVNFLTYTFVVVE